MSSTPSVLHRSTLSRIGLAVAVLAGCAKLSTPSQPASELPRTLPASSSYAENVLYSFCTSFDSSCGSGAYPSGNLILNGHTFYGTTSQAGINGYGTVYSLTPSGGSCCETTLHSFAGGNHDGANPTGIVMDAGGDIYGTTVSGGRAKCYNGCGVVFKLTPGSSAYTESLLYRFCVKMKGAVCQDGASPAAGLTLQNGVLYGTTEYGGAFGDGTVFSLTPSGSGYIETVLFSFKPRDGANPTALPIFDKHGAMYGTTNAGGGTKCPYLQGVSGCGTVYKLTRAGSSYRYRVIYRFRGRRDGANPTAGLTLGSNGTLYGTTTYGGAKRKGVVFSLTPSQGAYTEQVLHSFTGSPDGMYPYSALVMDKHQNLYGTTLEGGYPGRGAIYELTLTDSGYYEHALYSFQGSCDGRNPMATPVFGKSGANLYGTTVKGGLCGYGNYGYGTVYRLKR